MKLLCVLLLSITAISTAHAALTATTAYTIEGTKPKLSGGHLTAINAGDDFELLGVKFDNNSYFTDSDIKSGLTAAGVSLGNLTPTTLAQKLGNGTTGLTNVAYETSISTTDAEDDDGDSFIAGSLTGSATVQGWYYDNGGVETALTAAQMTESFCELAADNIVPYIKLEGPVTLSTEYGAPKSEVYDSSNANSPLHTSQGGAGKNPVRKLTPSGGAVACFAKPNPDYGTSQYSAPLLHPEWEVGKGFKVPNPLGAAKTHFPRTGFHGAFFDITVAGETAANVITASGSPIKQGGITVTLTKESTNVVRVRLSGPNHASRGGTFSESEFTLKSDASNVIYTFKLSKWFIARPSSAGDIAYDTGGTCTATTCVPNYCASLDAGTDSKYRVPSVGEYTNANAAGDDWSGTLSAWTNNTYARAIGHGVKDLMGAGITPTDEGGGLFAEWGNTYRGYYKDTNDDTNSSDFDDYLYWAVEPHRSGQQHDVLSYVGSVRYNTPSYQGFRAACVSP